MKIKSLRSSGRRGKPMQKPLATAVAAACSMSAMLVIPQAAAQDALEEIIVTATKERDLSREAAGDSPQASSIRPLPRGTRWRNAV